MQLSPGLKSRDARRERRRWLLPAVVSVAAMIGVVGGQEVGAAPPGGLSDGAAALEKRPNAEAARDNRFHLLMEGVNLTRLTNNKHVVRARAYSEREKKGDLLRAESVSNEE